MPEGLPDATLGGLIGKGFQGGVEVTLTTLILKWQGHMENSLSTVTTICELIEEFGLCLDPDIQKGDLDTVRLLRPEHRTTDAEARKVIQDSIDRGECATVEFKSSALADMKRLANTGDLHENVAVTDSCLKTVCAFLNTDGGTLLIGVEDDGIVCQGLRYDQELQGWVDDDWLLWWNGLVKGRFLESGSVFPYIQSQIVQTDVGYPVCVVQVTKRSRPSFVRRHKNSDHEFFARYGTQTESLKLPEFYEYVQTHFLANEDVAH